MADAYKYNYADYASPVYQDWKDWKEQLKGSMSPKDWYRYGEQAYGDWKKNINTLKKETVPELSSFATGPYGAFGQDFTDWSKAGTFEDYWKSQPTEGYSDFQKAAWLPKNRAAAQSIFDYSKWLYGAPTSGVDWTPTSADLANALGASVGPYNLQDLLAGYFTKAQASGAYEDTAASKLFRAAAQNSDVFNQLSSYLSGGANPGTPPPPAAPVNAPGSVSDQPYLYDPISKNFIYGSFDPSVGKYRYVQANNPNFV